jgi:hypothetical protein
MTRETAQSAKNPQNRGNFELGLVFIWLLLTNRWDIHQVNPRRENNARGIPK